MWRIWFVVLSFLAMAMSGCGDGGECKFDADCTETGFVCQKGNCVARETKKNDGGAGFDTSGPQKECQDGFTRVCFSGDSDKRDVGSCQAGSQTCIDGKWGECKGEILPKDETCNGLDDDCDGKIDNNCDCKPGETQDCYTGPAGTDGKGICKKGTQACDTVGKWGKCIGEVTPGTETCNQQDDNCDGKTDENCACKPGDTQPCYTGPKGTAGQGPCKQGSQACQSDGKWGKCNGETLPAKETCNGTDDNCDGNTDEGCDCKPGETQDCYTGPAGTEGKGICKKGTQACASGGKWGKCNGEILPAKETCNQQDDNCDGKVDDGCDCKPGETQDCYNGPAGTEGKGPCKKGSQTCDANGKWGLCNGEVKPDKELCDGKDNDCDGTPDNNLQAPNCGKQVGVCQGAKKRCGGAQGWQACTDAEYKQHNAAFETTESSCDGKDNDCDGMTDVGISRPCFSGATGCAKSNGTYACKGVCKAGTQTCVNGVFGSCAGEVLPKAEACNQQDDDCDGSVDEGNPQGGQSCTVSGQRGLCAEGRETCVNGQIVCSQVNQPTTEICNNQKDEDCNGKVDDCAVCSAGQTRPCYTGKAGCTGGATPGSFTCTGSCKAGTQACVNGQWATTCSNQVLPKAESCNWSDDDCDGKADNKGACFYSRWRRSSTPNGAMHIAFDPYEPKRGVAVGTNGRIWRTINGGTAWSTVTSPASTMLRHVAFNQRGLVIAVGDSGVLLRSTDGGASFKSATSGVMGNLYQVAIAGFGLTAIAVGDAGAITRSLDGGVTWQVASSGTTQDLRAVAARVNSNASFIVVGGNGTILTSISSGVTWLTRTSGVTQALSGASWNSSTLVVSGAAGTLLRSTNSGSSWTKIAFPDTADLGAVLSSGAESYVTTSTTGSAYYVSADDGRTFTKRSYGVSGSFGQISLQSPTALVAYSLASGAVGEGPARVVRTGAVGLLRSVAYDNGFGDTVAMAVGGSGWLLRSKDSGVTWSPVFVPVVNTLYGVSFDGNNAVAVGSSGLILHSSDKGLTWTKVTSGVSSSLYGVSIYGTNAIAVGSSGTILQSTDGGKTWTKRTAPSGLTTTTWNGVAIHSSYSVVVGSSGRVIRSTNTGQTWTQVGAGLTTATLRGVAMYSATTDVVAVGSSGTVLYSSNGGSTWTKPSSGTTKTLYAVHMDFGNAVAVGSGGEIRFSPDQGASWTKSVNSGYGGTLYGVFRNYATAFYVAVGGAGAVLRSKDYGDTWGMIRNPNSTLRSVALQSVSTATVVGLDGHVAKTNSSGDNWTFPGPAGLGSMYGVARASNGTMVAVGASSRILRSTNNGDTWTAVTSPKSSTFYNVASVSSSVFLAVGTSNTIVRSTNGGTTFSTITPPVSTTWRGISCVGGICIAVGSSGRVLRSINAGSNFAQVTSGTSSTLYDVAMGSAQRGVIVGSGGRVLYTTNGGTSWSTGTMPVTNAIYGVAALSDVRYILVNSLGGMYASHDGGKSWVLHAPALRTTLYNLDFLGTGGFAVGSSGTQILYTAP